MTNEDGVDEFLRVEEEATLLLDELGRLRKETESYASARGSLTDAAEGLKPLAEKLAETAQGVQAVSAVLREIGTPELSAGLSRLSDQLSSVQSDLDLRWSALEERLDQVEAIAGEARDGGDRLRSMALVGLTILMVGIGVTAALVIILSPT